MTTYAAHDADGTLISVGTVLADPLPKELTAVELSDTDAERLTRLGWGWDPATLGVTITPPSADIDPEHASDDPLAAEVAGLRAVIEALLADPEIAKVADIEAIRTAAEGSKDDDALVLAVAKVLGADPAEVRKKRDADPQWFADVVAKYGLSNGDKADDAKGDEVAVVKP